MGAAQKAVVVGGASGIGAAVVARLRAEGAAVLVWDRVGECDVICDIADPGEVESATQETLERLGVPDSVTITAGVGHSGLLAEVSVEEWDQVMAVNTRGVWLVMRSLVGPMTSAGGGSIVVVSSVSAHLVDRSMGLYCASKAALDMVVKVAASEWAPTLRVNAVAPGVTDTPMLGRAPRAGEWLQGVVDRTALGRLGTAEDIAEAVSGLHSMHWVTGQILDCDGGLSLQSPIDSFRHDPRQARPGG